MARTYLQPGNTVDAVAGTGGVTSGVPVVWGAFFGVPEVSATEGATYALNLVGVHVLPKDNAAIGAGAKAYWDAGAGKVTATVGTNRLIGAAVEAALAGDATVKVRLNALAV
jgi:predicted RecA/RadA family phage recombinase